MQGYANDLLIYINRLEPQHWMVILAGVIVVGLVCMKGMGSRSSY